MRNGTDQQELLGASTVAAGMGALLKNFVHRNAAGWIGGVSTSTLGRVRKALPAHDGVATIGPDRGDGLGLGVSEQRKDQEIHTPRLLYVRDTVHNRKTYQGRSAASTAPFPHQSSSCLNRIGNPVVTHNNTKRSNNPFPGDSSPSYTWRKCHTRHRKHNEEGFNAE